MAHPPLDPFDPDCPTRQVLDRIAGKWAVLIVVALQSRAKRFGELRHTCATLLLSNNVNQKVVQEMLGHATITQTMDTYSHVLPTMQDAATESALS
jgi:integrase